MKKLIILSIVLLTTLSATLFDNSSEPVKKEKTEKTFKEDMDLVKKLKLFNAKDYLKDYEHKRQAKKMLNESMKRF